MENSLLTIFDEIWRKTLYYSTGTLAKFLSNFKNSNLIGISPKFLHNIKTSTCIRKYHPSHSCRVWEQNTCLINLYLATCPKNHMISICPFDNYYYIYNRFFASILVL